MKIIDAHTHIDYITPDFQSCVVGCICCATTEEDWKNIIDLVKKDNRVYGAFGVHPWFANFCKKDFINRLNNLLENDSNYMIGEIGLDKHKPNMGNQIDIFVAQFNIAIKLKRTVCLHCVGAWDKILHILKQYKKCELPTIIVHGFNENENILNRLLQYKNIYFSLSKNYVYGRNSRIEQIPKNRILVESDGKKDIKLFEVVDCISQITNESDMADIIYDNTQRILTNG